MSILLLLVLGLNILFVSSTKDLCEGGVYCGALNDLKECCPPNRCKDSENGGGYCQGVAIDAEPIRSRSAYVNPAVNNDDYNPETYFLVSTNMMIAAVIFVAMLIIWCIMLNINNLKMPQKLEKYIDENEYN